MKNSLTWLRAHLRMALAGFILFAGVMAVAGVSHAYAIPNCQAPYQYNPDTNSCEKITPTPPGGSSSTDGGAGGSGGDSTNTNSPTPFPPKGCEVDPALHTGGCPQAGGGKCQKVDANSCDLVALYINPALRFVSAFVGVGVAIAIVYGGIQISSSGGDPAKAASGKNHIRNAIFTLVAYFFLYALLNFLIPGGIS